VREQCRRADIAAKTLLLEIVRQPDEESMRRMAAEIALRGMTRDDARASRRAQSGARHAVSSSRPFTFRYAPPGKEFKLELRFRRSEVDRQQIASALREAAEKLENDG
jgi:ParB family chromosome partitioning protein